jgi:hypothetical protein
MNGQCPATGRAEPLRRPRLNPAFSPKGRKAGSADKGREPRVSGPKHVSSTDQKTCRFFDLDQIPPKRYSRAVVKLKTSFVLSRDGQKRLANVAQKLGVGKSAVLELAIRAYAPPGVSAEAAKTRGAQ